MFKKLISILLSLTVVIIPTFTVASFAEGDEDKKVEVIATESATPEMQSEKSTPEKTSGDKNKEEATLLETSKTQAEKNVTEKSSKADEKSDTSNPIEPTAPVVLDKEPEVAPPVKPQKTIKVNLANISEEQLQELITIARSQQVALTKAWLAKKEARESEVYKNETFWQTCKRKSFNACNGAMSGLNNGILPSLIFATVSFLFGEGFKLTFIRQLLSSVVSGGVCSLLDLTGNPLSTFINIAVFMLSNKVITGPKAPTLNPTAYCQFVANMDLKNHNAVCGSPNNTCSKFANAFNTTI